MEVSAIIVTYNTYLPKFDELLYSLNKQVANIIIVDNSTDLKKKKELVTYLKSSSFIYQYIDMNGNQGIAYAQNIGIEYAKELTTYVLLLDQDSVLPKKMVNSLLHSYRDLESQGITVAAIGPSFIDEKHGEEANIISQQGFFSKRIAITSENSIKPIEADYIISSGMLISYEAIKKIGNLKNELFIDWVDIEWCMRARKQGYKIFVLPTVKMKHSIGDESTRFIRRINLHSDFRNYFIVRNSIYLALYENTSLNFSVVQLAKTPLYVLFYSYHSKRRLYSLYLLNRAIADGVFQRMGKGYFGSE